MELLLNEKPSFNELQLPKLMLHHVMSSFNTNKLKFVLSDNSNAWVLLKKTHKPTLHDMELHYSMLQLLFNKLVLLVLLKISYVYRYFL